MNTFTRIKIIKGIEYLYEITPYYDPETKKIRHKSKYLGKNDNGKAVRVRVHIPRHALIYGELLPFVEIIKEFRIREILAEYLSSEEIETVIAIVLNRVSRPLSLTHVRTWYEGTYLYHRESSFMSSQNISKLIDKIGSSVLPDRFIEAIIKDLKSDKTLVYDITSISSYSKGIDILEYGYNRDGYNLPQVNLSMIVDRQVGVAIGYEIYGGSIVDVRTLLRTVQRLKGYGVKECMLVLDRGFFSVSNIEGLNKEGISYIMSASQNNKEIKKAMSTSKRELSDPNNMKLYNGATIFVSEIKVKIGREIVSGYCYYMPSRQKEEEEGFYRRLYEIKEAIEGLSNTHRGIRERVEAIAGQYRQYLKVSYSDKGIKVKIRKKAVTQRINRMGKFILLYRGELSWQECLTIYKGKDIVEKGFDILKNDLEVNTPQVRKETTLRGLMFICFIGLMLRMRLNKRMEETGLSKRYSTEGLLLELSKLKLIEMTDGKRVKTELTKKQKHILSLLNLCA